MAESTGNLSSGSTAERAETATAAEDHSSQLLALLADIKQMAPRAEADLLGADTLPKLEEVRLAYLGKKGRLADFNTRMGVLSPAEKPIAGKLLNQHKARIITLHKKQLESLEGAELEERLSREAIDVTLPGTAAARGHRHPLLETAREVESIFRSMGFQVTEAPEIESEWVNFDALNMGADHPARDMQDTFFADRGRVLRTHTSGAQIRTMRALKPPMAAVCVGKVYRCDADATHSPMFMQMEAFLIDRNVSMSHLKGVLQEFLRRLFGRDVKMRFRPSFFPFTEPSAEVDVWGTFRKPEGEWLEILGCGMVHPNVLRNCGIDPEQWSGFALGMGLDRLTLLRYGINDIRLLYENDLRFLHQF